MRKVKYGREYDQLQFLDGAAGKPLVQDLTKDRDDDDDFPFPPDRESGARMKTSTTKGDPLQTLMHPTGRIIHDMTGEEDGEAELEDEGG